MTYVRTKRHTAIPRGDKVFYGVIVLILAVFTLIVLYPILHVVAASFSDGNAVSAGKVRLLPVNFSLMGYRAVFAHREFGHSYINTIVYTLLGTMINVTMAMLTAYPLSRGDLPGRNGFMAMFTFTMYFSGGMIPSYILIRDLGMIDTLWVMIIPGALSVYNMILTRTFIQSSIPHELLEAATIDGCGDFRYFCSVVLPLSKAILAVVALFSAVTHWNSYFNAMIYLNTRSKMPLQVVLREILVQNQVDMNAVADPELAAARQQLSTVLKYSMIVVSTVPILCVYPFIQKYFNQGVMIGSLKG